MHFTTLRHRMVQYHLRHEASPTSGCWPCWRRRPATCSCPNGSGDGPTTTSPCPSGWARRSL